MILSAVGVIATLWLGATGQLTLYIHPRYTLFTMVMATVGGILVLAAVVIGLRSSGDEEHRHDEELHDHSAEPRRAAGFTLLRGIGGAAVIVGAVAALLVVAPSSLSAERARISGLDAAAIAVISDEAPVLAGGDSTTYTVRDWSILLGQATSAAELTAQGADVIGFVLPDPGGSSNVFYLARYAITCCAVDAQVVAIPVRLDDWGSQIAEGDWVRVAGTFVEHPIGPVLASADLEQISEPDDPYVF